MNYKIATNKKLLLSILSFSLSCFNFCSSTLFAQNLTPNIVSTAGDYYANATGSLSWTLGEPIIETYSDATNTLTQGFQQTSYSITAVNNINQPIVNLSVFPNPFISSFTINCSGGDQLYAEVIDISGRVLNKKSLTEGKTLINLNMLSDAIYFLKVYDAMGNPMQTFKIEKTK